MHWPGGHRTGRFGSYHVVKMVHDGDKSRVFLAEKEGAAAERAAVKLYKGPYDRLAARIEKRYDIPSEGEIGMRLNPPDDVEPARHPIVRTISYAHEFGKRRGRRYIVQDFIKGVALKRIITCRDPRIARFPSAFIVQICQALTVVHAAGFVYRDLCAENLIVEPDNHLKLIDLGFVAPPSIAFAEGTGTPSYMAPEQIRGDPLTPACDVYSIGILIYELLCGYLPYRSRVTGDSDAAVEERRKELHAMHLERAVPELSDKIRQHRPLLSAVMTNCLQKAADERPQNTDDIIRGIAAKQWPPPLKAVPEPEEEPESEPAPPPKKKKKKETPWDW
jgi:serine/threonine protein kinase